ncbi:MAG: inositol monophosphatase family protein [Parachlamydiales bacterium]|jgi:myo-inositol-1(or 4)-monophosphatase
MEAIWENALATAIEAAKEGAVHLKKYWGRLKSIRQKTSHSDLVTEADEASENAIKEVLLRNFPSDGILAEESGGPRKDIPERLWVIDPLDGTTNYTHQYPMFAISIALLWKGSPVVGVVYNPIMDELFSARLNGGAFLNGQKINVSTVPDLEHSLLATGFSYDRRVNPENNYAPFCLLTHLCHGVRRSGSACIDLAYVAAGRLEGYWERGLQPWDVASGTLLVQEAGGHLTGYKGVPLDIFSGRVVATNKQIHAELCAAIESSNNKE